MAFTPSTNYNSTIMVNQDYEIVSPTTQELVNANPILTFNYTQAQEAATNAASSANTASAAATTATNAAAQATEISDPEGWRTATRDMISDLYIAKEDAARLYVGTSGGCFKNTTTAIGAIPARSMCITLKFDEDFSVANWAENTQVNIIGDFGYGNSLYNGICLRMTSDGRLYLLGGRTISGNVNLTLRNFFTVFFGGTSKQIIPAGTYALVMTVSMNEASTFSQIFVNGDLKDSDTVTTINTTNYNAGTGFDVCTVSNFHGTDFSNGCFSGGISRVMAFNFDMSAADAPYTIADYQNGKPIPPALCSTTATQRALVAYANYTIKRNASTTLIKDISGNGNDATVVGDVKGDKDLLISTFVDELKTQISQQS